jgi:hypothetical protein
VKNSKKVIVRIKGGLGNQLFAYAAAKQFAVRNNAELVIDSITGFMRDFQYKRRYSLDCFNLPVRHADYFERLEPFEFIRRPIRRAGNALYAFDKWSYFYDGYPADYRDILKSTFNGVAYLDGVWPGAKYLSSVEDILRKELVFKENDVWHSNYFGEIIAGESVFIHLRTYNEAPTHDSLSIQYYVNSIQHCQSVLTSPKFYVFSDDPGVAECLLRDIPGLIFIKHDFLDDGRRDLWLMSKCKHGIIANSTLSWWAAWINQNPKKLCIAPNAGMYGVESWTLGKSLGSIFTVI